MQAKIVDFSLKSFAFAWIKFGTQILTLSPLMLYDFYAIERLTSRIIIKNMGVEFFLDVQLVVFFENWHSSLRPKEWKMLAFILMFIFAVFLRGK